MAESAEKIVQTYLSRMAEIRSAGGATDETSYYSPFETLMNEVGRLLDPNIICNSQVKNQGAGHPDFGLYSKNQCAKGAPKKGQGKIPEHGVVEAQGLDNDSLKTSIGKQTEKYLSLYGLVLVTNYRDFRLIVKDDAGKAVQREFFSLADDEKSFWATAGTPKNTAQEKGVHLVEFLKRVLMNAAPVRVMIPQGQSPYSEGKALFVTFVKMLMGTFFGLYVGKLFGRSLIVEIGQNPIDMEVPGAMLGAIVGCTLARVFTRRKKAGKE